MNTLCGLNIRASSFKAITQYIESFTTYELDFYKMEERKNGGVI